MVCLYSNCDAEPFNTNVALNQHYLCAHQSQRRGRNEGLFCDYKDCDRHTRSFERLDGLRNHLRAAHKEYMPKKGGAGKNALNADHRDHLPWRRCPKCLGRTDSNHEHDDCPNCNLWVSKNYNGSIHQRRLIKCRNMIVTTFSSHHLFPQTQLTSRKIILQLIAERSTQENVYDEGCERPGEIQY